ncbi:hypothetical protein [Streptomyces sp. SID3343]|uniref:hypothetical protein n=1 Tax=Streptomyces sp. SID3343 TaxID=2690260 RepID=UPI001368A901|nr:hypothetical protein [Streptomyces sp. SID3343]MYW01667.1 hypothetical protein [Streptomyces sp. SID3343]
MSAIRYELARARTLRGTWCGALALLALSAAATWVAVRQAGAVPVGSGEAVRLLTAGPGRTPVLIPAILVTVALACAREQRREALPTLLLALPRRTRVYTAKLAGTALAAASIAVLAVATDAAVARVVFGGMLPRTAWTEGPAPRVLAGFVAYTMLAAVLGLAIGMISRGAPLIALAAAALPLGGERLIASAVRAGAPQAYQDFVRYLPFRAADRMLSVSGSGLAPLAGAAVFTATTLVVTVIAMITFARRRA